ncbi:MAG TPA: phosphocholine cytidylyltransferase family protein [Burkholderiaceae bacterium]|nr:phosphocholine cytidylyltransferase family protein [Burkholderiaceae bacterium]
MKAIVLAAGRGRRMKSLTEDRPKCLVELWGKPLLDWQLAALRAAAIRDVAVVTGYRRELLVTRGLVEFHNARWEATNMVASLCCAEAWLRGGPCIVSYSDIFFDAGAVTSLMRSTAPIAVTYDPNWRLLWERRFADPLADAETFRINADGTLAEIGNRPESIDAVQGQYMGLLRFTAEGWDEVKRIRSGLTAEQRDRMHMTATLQMVIEAGRVPVTGVPYRGQWGEVDSAEDLAAYEPRAGSPRTSGSA